MSVSARTGQRLVRLSYELEYLASRLQAEELDRESENLRAAAKCAREAGDSVLDKRGDKK